jgi:Ca2+-binding EF-hand superfamily protein
MRFPAVGTLLHIAQFPILAAVGSALGRSALAQRWLTVGVDLPISAGPDQGTRVHRRRSRTSQIATWKGHTMISRRTMVSALTIGTLLAVASPALAKSNMIKMFDTDNDGTIDLGEAKKAASAAFDKLERDHDGTLDKHELARRLSAKELAAADPDHDGTLSKDEYLAVVEQRFNAADPDHDGTLDAKELNSAAGRALLRLLK